MDRLLRRIKRHERLSLVLYKDKRGVLTIGYGHNMKNPISAHAAEVILRDDLLIAQENLFKLPRAAVSNLNDARREVLIEMIFNLGIHGVLEFRRMIDALIVEDFTRAAEEMLDSRWAKQVGKRADELAKIMRTGRS